jgi:hypothetical protein
VLKLILMGTKNEAQVLNVTVSYWPRPPVHPCAVPFGYLAQLRIFILLWLVSWPLALAKNYEWASIAMVAFVAFIMLKIEQLAVQVGFFFFFFFFFFYNSSFNVRRLAARRRTGMTLEGQRIGRLICYLTLRIVSPPRPLLAVAALGGLIDPVHLSIYEDVAKFLNNPISPYTCTAILSAALCSC